jgi:hypothetical protein
LSSISEANDSRLDPLSKELLVGLVNILPVPETENLDDVDDRGGRTGGYALP